MPRHRATSSRSRMWNTLATSGAVISACMAVPATAAATPITTTHHRSNHHTLSHHPTKHGQTRHHRLRPMTSGEQQYRNGCLQGYITDDCQQFNVPSLTHKGINPFL